MATKQLTINGTSWMIFKDHMKNRMEFKTYGNLWSISSRAGTFGQLPRMFWDSASTAKYTVMSYQTPIAWLDENDNWIMPPVKYSTTTSKAQGRIAPGVVQLNEEKTN